MVEQAPKPTATPTVEIQLDKLRHLRVNFNALVLMEKETGKNFLNEINLKNLSATDIRAMVWAMLVHEDLTLTLEAVGEMLSGPSLDLIIDKISEAIEKAFPKATGSKKKKT